MLQVITRPVKGPVFGVETHVGAVGRPPVTQAARRVSDELQLLRGEHFLVAEITCNP